LNVQLKGRDPDDAFSDIPYEKGANFLRLLEHHFGRKSFDVFLRNYFDTHAFQSMTTKKFLSILKKELFKGDQKAWDTLKVDTWVYQGGLPDNVIIPKSDRFEKTRAAAAAFAKDSQTEGIQKTWVTAEWLDFLNSLPASLTKEQMAKLDSAYAFTQTGNSEVLFAWLMNCIRTNYEPAYPALDDFLTRQGRRKFLKPLYQAMMDQPKTVEMARALYKKTRDTYHPISVNTLDKIVTY
jgi:aminopeptidase N